MTWNQLFWLGLLVGLAAAFLGGILGLFWGRYNYRKARRKEREFERKQTREHKYGSSRENIANRFANVVLKSDLTKHYEVRRLPHHLGIAEYVGFEKIKDGTWQAEVEVNFYRPPDHHVIIRIPDGRGWHFGSDNKSLDEAVAHLLTGLWRQVD